MVVDDGFQMGQQLDLCRTPHVGVLVGDQSEAVGGEVGVVVVIADDAEPDDRQCAQVVSQVGGDVRQPAMGLVLERCGEELVVVRF